MSLKSLKSIRFFLLFFSTLISKITLLFKFSQRFLLTSLSALTTLYYSYFLSIHLLGSQFTLTRSHISLPNMHTLYSEILGTKTALIHFSTPTQVEYQAYNGYSINMEYMGAWRNKHLLFPPTLSE